ncbi:hypothetical protein EON80_19330 [bacterium]|nr:MAG: hypothetical protein EON80_19330 [bacterium]
MVPLASGCMFLKAPDPAPEPTKVPTPKAPFFDPAAGQPQSTPLNNPADPTTPVAFRLASAINADTVILQPLKVTQKANSVKAGVPAKDVISLGTPERYKLAGIIGSTTDPTLQGARTAIAKWTLGQDLNVQIDGKYPKEIDGTQVVQIFFTGSKDKPYAGTTLSLNRMLVRSGWAVVDMYSPTSFDTSQWTYDEAHAKRSHYGIWATGQAIQQRLPAKVLNIKNSQSSVKLPPVTRMGTTAKPNTTGLTSSNISSAAPVASQPMAPVQSSAAPASSAVSVPVPAR